MAGRSLVALAILALGSVWSVPGLAAGTGASPPGASACSGCHGPVEARGSIPSLGKLEPGEIERRMLAYRNGEQMPTVMDRIARGFSPEEIRAIAAWYGRS